VGIHEEESMRKISWLCCVLVVFVVVGSVCLSAGQRGAEGVAKPEEFLGTWSGTWDGGGTGGGFELTLEQGKDGPITGKVSVTGEPTYKTVMKSVAFDGKKMTAKYDFPADETIEIVLAASFDGDTATGTWSAEEKAARSQVASGTWKVTKK
jgi:hypothetical protein